MTATRARLVPVAAILGLAMGAIGCDRLSHGCTQIGCQDGATLTLQRGDGLPPGLAASLNIDGRQVECAVPQAGVRTACDTDVLIESRETASCTEEQTKDARILKCVPTGKFEEIISIKGTPVVLRATARMADAVVAERTFEPKYKTFQPNGPDCEPICRQWSEVWALP